MPPVDTLATFFGVAVLLALSPGPDNLCVLALSARHGTRAGLRLVLGLCMGLLVQTALVMAGVSALLAASPVAFGLLKLAGALYLARLAWLAWCHAGQGRLPADGRVPGIRQGVCMNLANPKVVLFFLALLPQFVDPELGHASWQLAWLGSAFILATLLVFGAVACAAGALSRRLARSPSLFAALDRLAALLFAGMALAVLL
ncbi:LysE family translocator [Crenobacter caeni]|uniref:LysE family translocator n=1 Tax=Crenobacter caeni TaxID=2705474 RepID=A0A6B2KUY3_9NEIS|nr:LysE family translocator [Crenobacter caeni]NDV13860.1 LysE family translocator [Crenobacter caeni]